MRIHVAMAAAAACVLAAVPANSADIAAPVVEPVVVPSDWTGFHVGIFGGLAGGDTAYPFDLVLGGTSIVNGDVELDGSGLFGGIGAGYDFQFGNVVLGILGDISLTNYESNVEVDISTPLFGGASASAEVGSELDWLATVRGRLGFAWEDTLFYGTGGVAFGELETGFSASLNVGGGGGSIAGSVTTDHIGWAAGAGVEHKLTENVSLSMEYLYVDLGDENILTVGGGASAFTLDVNPQFHTLKAGLNYRF